MSRKRPADAMLGGGDGAEFGGEPLHQGLVTDTGMIYRQDYETRLQSKNHDQWIYGGTGSADVEKRFTEFNLNLMLVVKDEIALIYCDKVTHRPSIYNKHTTRSNSQAAAKQYKRAGVKGSSFAYYPDIITCLNRAWVTFDDEIAKDVKFVTVEKAYEGTFLGTGGVGTEINTRLGFAYFPAKFKHFMAHFAFKCMGVARTPQDPVDLARCDVPVNIAGKCFPFATETIPFGTVAEWYLIHPDDLTGQKASEYDDLLENGKLPMEKVLVGLRPNYPITYAELDRIGGENLKKLVELFCQVRILGKSVNFAQKGTRCHLIVGKGAYCL